MAELGDTILPFDLDLDGIATSDPPGFGSLHVSSAPTSMLQPQQSTGPQDPNGMSTQTIINSAEQPVIGAGPLPQSYGMHSTPVGGNNLTEFTKRRNWSQRVIEELKDFLYILSHDGRFVYASPSIKELTGHGADEIVGKLMADFIHPEDGTIFIREFNESIASGHPLRFFFRLKKKNDQYTIFESHGHPHFASEAASFGANSGASFCRGFFMMARPYPTKNAAMLDSFLEHKIENERLRKRIADLRREEQEDLEGQQYLLLKHQSSQSATASTSEVPPVQRTGTSTERIAAKDYNEMPPPAKPTVSNNALTRQNLDEALASSRPDSINDKMARYEGANHLETIEMLTGLRYRDGERSRGISTGAASPTLVRGDVGIAILVDKDGRPQGHRAYNGSPYAEGLSGDKKKKIKVSDEYVCTDCGTLDSPEWRKGPQGPKTLCNACGLRWAKKEKKKSGSSLTDGGGIEAPVLSSGASMTVPAPTTLHGLQTSQGMPQYMQGGHPVDP